MKSCLIPLTSVDCAPIADQLAVRSSKANSEPFQLDEFRAHALGRTTRRNGVLSGRTRHPCLCLVLR